MGLHVSRAARRRYPLEERLFVSSGRADLANHALARRFAKAINDRREQAGEPAASIRAGDISAMALLDDILDYVIELYREERNPPAIAASLESLERRLGHDEVDATLATFVDEFPALAAMRGQQRAADYLAAQTDGRANREVALEEALLLWLANMNPVYAPVGELLDDRPLEEGSAYGAAIRGLHRFFAEQPGYGPDDDDLISLLRKPALESPDSLAGQLAWIRQHWPMVLDRFGDQLTRHIDVLAEEERAAWMRFHGTHGGDADGDTSALHGFEGLDLEYERFSQDREWMPRLVLLAKSTYVWLDQLARQYGRPIWRLDQVPDEELDRLARAGFSGLWLIGLWERSHASQRIKQMRGNPEAVASAYSLMEYEIADDLGGEEAFRNLRDRAWARGIRLASDMVPNHMGVDSRWVIEHPDWFMSRPDPPYPAYSYSGPNLSSDERVGIYLEDHYFDSSDAAVTFKREDRWSGEARYVYHGNDGTSTPWNDTAQLDYLKPEVREALIQTILHVARLFPVIRFDAAMTLAKKHIARLWYPEPGSAGAIPSRAEYSLSRREFDRRMPHEFWREVVDRVAQEVPDTLLLAEAFWLMEGYFVRTLGMHRVYNSAFMNMLRDEKNAEYRLVIKNTLEFDPQILKRYVNFMNNPDERTAIDQFGDGDKYFGVCTLMATMPGLPMFGHGQLEGFTEKYGMEFRRAGLQEEPKGWLVERHEREIFPLLHRRELFAEVADFQLFDFYTPDGAVNEDVFAYSNRGAGERSLVVYNNRYAETAGSIRVAAVSGRALAGALDLDNDEQKFLVMREMRSGQQYLRNVRELHDEGLQLSLAAYGCHVFLDLYEVHDSDGRYARLAASLGGEGVADVEAALRERELAPFHDALRAALASTDEQARRALLAEVAALAGRPPPRQLRPVPAGAGPKAIAREYPETHRAWLAATAVEGYLARAKPELAKGGWIDEWLADRVLPNAAAAATALALEAQPTGVLNDERVRGAIGVHDHDGVTWFNRERFEQQMVWFELQRGARASAARLKALLAAAERAGYRLERLMTDLERPMAGRARR